MDGIILAHGGAGDIPDSRVEPKVNFTLTSNRGGYLQMKIPICTKSSLASETEVKDFS